MVKLIGHIREHYLILTKRISGKFLEDFTLSAEGLVVSHGRYIVSPSNRNYYNYINNKN